MGGGRRSVPDGALMLSAWRCSRLPPAEPLLMPQAHVMSERLELHPIIGSASSGRQGDYLVQSMSGTGRRSGQTIIPMGGSDSLYVHSTPSIDSIAVTLDDKRERRSRISPVFSSEPPWLHRPMCFMVNGPESSCIRAGRFFESVAVSSHSPRWPAYPVIWSDCGIVNVANAARTMAGTIARESPIKKLLREGNS